MARALSQNVPPRPASSRPTRGAGSWPRALSRYKGRMRSSRRSRPSSSAPGVPPTPSPPTPPTCASSRARTAPAAGPGSPAASVRSTSASTSRPCAPQGRLRPRYSAAAAEPPGRGGGATRPTAEVGRVFHRVAELVELAQPDVLGPLVLAGRADLDVHVSDLGADPVVLDPVRRDTEGAVDGLECPKDGTTVTATWPSLARRKNKPPCPAFDDSHCPVSALLGADRQVHERRVPGQIVDLLDGSCVDHLAPAHALLQAEARAILEAYGPNTARTTRTEAAKPTRSAMSAAGSAWRYREIPTAPM